MSLLTVTSEWTDFAIVAGGATAALLGLLFVAVSIRVEVIARSDELRQRSAQTLSLLLTGLLAALLLTIPEQARWVLGVEFLALAVATAVTVIALDPLTKHERERERTTILRVLDLTTPNITTCVLLAAVGVTLLLGETGGLYLLVPALVAVLAGGVWNAWLILVTLSE
jgi:hypothetical protein